MALASVSQYLEGTPDDPHAHNLLGTRICRLCVLCIYMPAIDRSLCCFVYTCQRLIVLSLIAGLFYHELRLPHPAVAAFKQALSLLDAGLGGETAGLGAIRSCRTNLGHACSAAGDHAEAAAHYKAVDPSLVRFLLKNLHFPSRNLPFPSRNLCFVLK